MANVLFLFLMARSSPFRPKAPRPSPLANPSLWAVIGLFVLAAFVSLWLALVALACGIVGLLPAFPRLLFDALLVAGGLLGLAWLASAIDLVLVLPAVEAYWPLLLVLIVPLPLALLVEAIFFAPRPAILPNPEDDAAP